MISSRENVMGADNQQERLELYDRMKKYLKTPKI